MGKARPLWLLWVGEGIPELSHIWCQYLRRFAIDHWYRFAKQRLHWTLPKLGTREQCERWSDLMPLLTWQLWLVRDQVNDRPLPWQKSIINLTLSLSCSVDGSSFSRNWHTITSSQTPWKVPGWFTGQPRRRKIPCPIVKKGTSCPKKQQSKSA